MIKKNSANSTEKSKLPSLQPEHREHEERILVNAARKGECTAFDVLCKRYSSQLVRATYRVTRNREDAEDAVQDALLSAYIHVRNFDGRSSFSTWLTRIAINSALMILRKRRSLLAMATESADGFAGGETVREIPDHALTPERQLAQSEEEKMLKKAIEGLRPNLRKVIEIQHLQESSIRETAKAIGISVVAAKSRLFHAKAALRKSTPIKFMRKTRIANRLRALSAA
ncbi:MAG TPA: sigma-70 family RNA polymerase sigma factor [Candidatus Acidoferrum sp.]|nr:sigma-70 family RNA polymerase sigma factor [Candidatus Acidoferrum sp.]